MLAGVVVAIYFQHQSAQSIILSIFFAGLITMVIAQADTIQKLQNTDNEQEDHLNYLEHNTNEHFKDLSSAFVEDLQTLEAHLSDQFGTELHELALLIANQKFGDDE